MNVSSSPAANSSSTLRPVPQEQASAGPPSPPDFTIAAFGEALIDVLPSGEVIGGAPLNFAVRCAQVAERIAGEVFLISRVGQDQRGQRILKFLQESKVHTATVQQDAQHPTGWVEVTVEDGQPSYTIAPDVAWDFIDMDAQIERIGHGAELFYFGTLAQRSRQTATTLHHLLEGRVGRLNLLDLNLRRPYPPPESIRWSMQQATVLKCNDGELSWLADCFGWRQDLSPASIAARLQDQFSLDVVFWTRGSQGCVWQAGTDQITAKVPQLEQEPDADTVGAGDAAAAALAIGLVAGWPPQKIVHAANLFGAYVASRRGATQPLPDWILAQVLTE